MGAENEASSAFLYDAMNRVTPGESGTRTSLLTGGTTTKYAESTKLNEPYPTAGCGGGGLEQVLKLTGRPRSKRDRPAYVYIPGAICAE
jgi:hypothetical protein